MQPQPTDPPATMASPPSVQSHAGMCRNCGAILHGAYCQDCGQSAHDPLASVAHAVEDVFESFWHVDGRIFRSLRDLLVPGRIARAYLDGHRVRYIPPLRLYVVLSVITFFIAHVVAAGIIDGPRVVVRNSTLAGNPFAAATTVQQVEAKRTQLLAELQAERADAADTPLVAAALAVGVDTLNRQADQRIAELGGKPVVASGPATGSDAGIFGDEPIGADGSWQRRLQRQWTRNAQDNLHLFAKDGRKFAERVIAHVPTLLLVLVPLFALVLRMAYLLRPMGYLAHLVVALYSHSFLLLAALAWMLVRLLERVVGGTVLSTAAGAAFWIGVPIFLLLSQKRIYGDGWLLTLLRWTLIGLAYFFLATLALALAMMLSFVGKA